MSANAETLTPQNTILDDASAAGQRIAPTWPLDQLIAVNPWWEMRGESIQDVAARIALLEKSSHQDEDS